ncbi:hypothetical protein DOY81_005121 [Sarcophaga bullata]|nr:hypothetical protein DOY81_005121 [Sarcophaga bullata]
MWSRTVVILFLVTLMLTGVLTEELELPPYIKFTVDGKTYTMCFNKLNWVEGMEHCRHVNKIYGSVPSMEVNQMMIDILKPYGVHQNKNSIWLGAYDIDHEGEFVWLSTGRTVNNFTNWDVNMPDNWNGFEHCVEMLAENGKWNDSYCDFKKHILDPLCNACVFKLEYWLLNNFIW